MSAPAAQYSTQYLAEDIGPTITATASLMIIFCTVFVGLRYYARYLTSTKFGAEDVIIPFAWLAEMGLCAVGIARLFAVLANVRFADISLGMVKEAGTGRHVAYNNQVDPTRLTKHFQGIIINEFVHPTAVAFPKLCVAILYLRVFTHKLERGIAWGLIAVIFSAWLSFFVATWFQCVPFAYIWDKTIPGGHCFDTIAFAYSSSVPNIVTDVVVVFLPIRTVLELRVSTQKKIGLMLIFLTSSVGIIASIVRTVVVAKTDILDDITFSNVPLVNWTIIEPGLYLLAACALSFKPLFRMVAEALHLGSVLSHTKSVLHKTTHTKVTRTDQKSIHMDTFKSASSDGFTKLNGGTNGKDDDKGHEEYLWFKQGSGHSREASESAMSVIVTRTVEVSTEDLEVGTHVRSGDHVHYDANVARAV